MGNCIVCSKYIEGHYGKYCSSSCESHYRVEKERQEKQHQENLDAIEKQNDLLEEQNIREQAELDKDCLLYTSPSPRDISGSRMPSSA